VAAENRKRDAGQMHAAACAGLVHRERLGGRRDARQQGEADGVTEGPEQLGVEVALQGARAGVGKVVSRHELKSSTVAQICK